MLAYQNLASAYLLNKEPYKAIATLQDIVARTPDNAVLLNILGVGFYLTESIVSEKDQFYLEKEEPYKSCLLALRTIILSTGEGITETKKYGMPCFCFQGKAFCYLWTDKITNEPYILFVEGKPH